jgi:hypothetical protein
MLKEIRVKPVSSPAAIEREFRRFWDHYYGGQRTTMDRANVEDFLRFITRDHRSALQKLIDRRVVEVWNSAWEWQIVRLWDN